MIIGFIVETLREEGQLTNYWPLLDSSHLPALYDVMYRNLEQLLQSYNIIEGYSSPYNLCDSTGTESILGVLQQFKISGLTYNMVVLKDTIG